MKIAVVYSSKRGKTREMAEIISGDLKAVDPGLLCAEASEVQAAELEAYDFLVMGSSTWANGDLEEGFIELERDLADFRFNGKKGAVFGPGNKRFPRFCEAVEILENRLKNCGVKILVPSLKTDHLSGQVLEETREWSLKLKATVESIVE